MSDVIATEMDDLTTSTQSISKHTDATNGRGKSDGGCGSMENGNDEHEYSLNGDGGSVGVGESGINSDLRINKDGGNDLNKESCLSLPGEVTGSNCSPETADEMSGKGDGCNLSQMIQISVDEKEKEKSNNDDVGVDNTADNKHDNDITEKSEKVGLKAGVEGVKEQQELEGNGSKGMKQISVDNNNETSSKIEKSSTDCAGSSRTNKEDYSDTAQPSGSGESVGRCVEKAVRYKCPKCSRVTKDKRVFDNHSCDKEISEDKVEITVVHDKEADRFVCKECDFTNKGHGFEEHLMCHLMMRPYQCLYCKECFINRREISRHVLKVHNGAKMSCALRALKRAKGIIKEATEAGSLVFMAKVAGKVPLEKDPDRKRGGNEVEKTVDTVKDSKTNEGTTKGDSETKNVSSKETEVEVEQTGISDVKTTQELSKKTINDVSQKEESSEKVNKEGEESSDSDKVNKEGDLENKGENNDIERENNGGHTSQLISHSLKTSVPTNAFSKLREVLTSERPTGVVRDIENGSTLDGEPSTDDDKVDKTAEDLSGIKILASYSLNEDSTENATPANDKATCETSKGVEPNFIMASPVSSPDQEPEMLSFLGPERPIFKPESPSHSILPQPAPTQTSDPSASSLPPPPQLASAPVKKVKTSDFFICGFDCSFTCINKSSFLQHLKDIHSSRPDFPCYYCGYRDVSEDSLVTHIADHADSHDKTKPLYSCAHDDCTFVSNMATDLISHTKSSHPDNSTPTCQACGVVFPDIPTFQTHLEDNIIHIVNCPHCPSKATDRRAILNHISSIHPGKPKMVSVAKQLICDARREHGYGQSRGINEMPPPMLTPAPLLTPGSGPSSVIDQLLRRPTSSCGSLITDSLANPDSAKRKGDMTPESGQSPQSESSGVSGMRVKEEMEDEETMETGEGENESSTYIVDENGVRRRIYVPMSERQAENFRCNYCTFVARDVKRLACHERSHGMPPTRKDRFKCMFCPQGFDSELKFRLHITCHPGLIKFLLYRCKKCEFDSNQKHTIVKHITCNRDKKHRGYGPVENHYTIISRSLESRVLECERCDYMTRHKIHMAIHYQREHGILRDKSDFRIEGLTPYDTPFSGNDNSPSLPPDAPVLEPIDSTNPASDVYRRPTYKKSKIAESSEMAALSLSEINERNELFTRLVSQQTALQPGSVLENQARKFKCPICKYLLPKAADLKNHVKRHSEVGQITLVMFRCKYCSCMSTARELLYDHLRDKHPGKPIALVKKIVFIDTTETDRSFAETAVEESLQQLEESVHNDIMSAINSNVSSSKTSSNSPSPSPTASFEQLFVIPEGGETFTAALHCPKCTFSSHNRQEIIQHVTSTHPEVKVISSDEDVEKLAKATTKDLHRSKSPKYPDTMLPEVSTKPGGIPHQEEVLIVPDDQVFKEPALCSRCNFSTVLRKEMVSHLQQCHPEICVMGRNSYPVQVSAIGNVIGTEHHDDDSCIVGSGSLDNRLRCLYENYGSQMKCLICGVNRPKKFFIHVHILRHLNIFLWKCAFCAHRGLQKYKMVDHIKKIHPGKPMSVRYLRVNVESRVAQFLSQFSVLQKSAQLSTPEVHDKEEEADVSQNFQDSDTNDNEAGEMAIQTSSGSTYTLGSEALDEKISCLYKFTQNQVYSCNACVTQLQRKFAIHRHIIISHLKVALLSCGYCGMQGVEKHQMVDHSLVCHISQPVSFHNNSVDLDRAVSDFLSESCNIENKTGKLSDSDKTELIELMKFWNSSNKKMYNSFSPEGVKIRRPYKKSQSDRNQTAKKTTGNRCKTIVDPGVIMLGREALDKELNCLYQSRGGGQFRCLICRWEFPRKYPLHRHIMLKHLRMNLVACPYCGYEGVEKYTVSAHIKDEHKDMPVSIKYVQPDVGSRVRHFVEDMANGISTSQDLIRRPGSSSAGASPLTSSSKSTLSGLVKMKREEGLDDFADEDEDGDEGNDDEGNGEEEGGQPSGQGLVVAMFGKKNKKSDNDVNDDIVVKTEVEDEEYEEGSKLDDEDSNDNLPTFFPSTPGADNDQYASQDSCLDEEDMEGGLGEGEENEEGLHEDLSDKDRDSRIRAIRAKFIKSRSDSTLKRPLMQAYAPGSYRSPSGGKPKALDVITKIKVLKSREGPITKFCCEKCTFSSVHRSNVVRHIYKIHERYQTHVCPICNYQTLSLILMQTHMGKEHPGVEYTEESFAINPPRTKPRSKPLMGPLSFQRRKQPPKTPVDLKPPEPTLSPSIHLGPKQYACAFCHYETNTQEDIMTHTRENHTDSNSTESKKDGLIIPKPESDACWEKSKKAVKRKVSENSTSGVVRSKRKFIFEKGEELIQCNYCDVRETSMGRMQHHLEWDHPGEEFKCKRIPAWRFVCKTCSVKTMATSKMKYHLNRHINYRPYTCVNCGAFFPSPDQCRRHARSARHEEQYVYIRNTKKEQKVEELLQETRQLALKIQEDAAKDPTFDIGNIDTFLSLYQDTKSNLKRSSGTGPRNKKAKASPGEKAAKTTTKKQPAKSAQSAGVEMNVTIQCYHCKFESSTVHLVYQHHLENHGDEKFLWIEMERGFTCDITGEAVVDTSSLLNDSEEVGYSTKMTLGVGNKTMRFKCKNCDFSSCVIQAMKSHLKSHQPKGFICPYCSRSFSGKEKLMRHQYCLHKGLKIWVIHLRKATAETLASVKLKPPEENSGPNSSRQTEDTAVGSEGVPDSKPSTSAMPVSYVCNKCPFTSENLVKYKRHLAQDHKEFRRSKLTTDAASSRSEADGELSKTKNEDLGSDNDNGAINYRCGHCEFSAPDKSGVEEHQVVEHPDQEQITLDLKEDRGDESSITSDISDIKKKKRKRAELMLNLEPRVKVRRMSKSTLAAYKEEDETRLVGNDGEEDEGIPDDATIGSLDLHDETHSEMFSDDTYNEGIDDVNIEEDGEFDDKEEDEDEGQMKKAEEDSIHDNISEADSTAHMEHGSEDGGQPSLKYTIKLHGGMTSKTRMKTSVDEEEDNEDDDDDEEGDLVDNEQDEFNGDVSSPTVEDSEDLARQLGLVGEESTSSMIQPGDDSDMMIMEFKGMRPKIHDNNSNNGKDEEGAKDDDNEDEEEDFDNVSMTLASPLPMISLGDGMDMSPGLMHAGSKAEDEVDSEGEEGEGGFSPQTLLDV